MHYATRCESAAVSYNSNGEFFRKVHKEMQSDFSPGKYTKGHIERNQKAAEKPKMHRKTEIRKRKPRSFACPDEHYRNVDAETTQLLFLAEFAR